MGLDISDTLRIYEHNTINIMAGGDNAPSANPPSRGRRGMRVSRDHHSLPLPAISEESSILEDEAFAILSHTSLGRNIRGKTPQPMYFLTDEPQISTTNRH